MEFVEEDDDDKNACDVKIALKQFCFVNGWILSVKIACSKVVLIFLGC